jgi:hypothetical protein
LQDCDDPSRNDGYPRKIPILQEDADAAEGKYCIRKLKQDPPHRDVVECGDLNAEEDGPEALADHKTGELKDDAQAEECRVDPREPQDPWRNSEGNRF